MSDLDNGQTCKVVQTKSGEFADYELKLDVKKNIMKMGYLAKWREVTYPDNFDKLKNEMGQELKELLANK